MGFIKGLLFKEEDKPLPKKSTQKPAPVVEMYTQSTITAGSNDYLKYLDEVMDKANMPGPDFYEFSKSLVPMASLAIPEDQKFNTVLSTFSVMGATKEKLVESGNKYLGILDDNAVQFAKQLSTERDAIAARKQQIENTKLSIEALHKEIETKSQAIADDGVEILRDESKLTVEESNFRVALEQKKNLITYQIDKIKTLGNEAS